MAKWGNISQLAFFKLGGDDMYVSTAVKWVAPIVETCVGRVGIAISMATS